MSAFLSVAALWEGDGVGGRRAIAFKSTLPDRSGDLLREISPSLHDASCERRPQPSHRGLARTKRIGRAIGSSSSDFPVTKSIVADPSERVC